MKLITLTFTFTFRAFSRCFHPKRLTISTFIRRKGKKKQYFAVGTVKMFIEKCQAPTIATFPIYNKES